MKKISANYIFPGNSSPIKNGVVILNDDGVILDVINPADNKINYDGVELHKGIICPGFVNAHCHLELSHLKGKVAELTQLHGFVKEVMEIREDFSEEQRSQAIIDAQEEMIRNGIVAVGDISNGPTSFNIKYDNKMSYYTFVEVFGLDGEKASNIINRAQQLINLYPNNNITITPHASYSLSEELIRLVNKQNSLILSIHNQETAAENELFNTGTGLLYEQLAKFSNAISNWQPTGKSALPSYLKKYENTKKLQLVHNTYTSATDVDFAKKSGMNIYWCFCPNANVYIEGKQPDYNLFVNEKCTIGTDSLASNWSLSILDELKTITKKNPFISLEKLIKWATYNGAEFLGFEELGSIETGKTPGLNLIENVDLINLQLNENSRIQKLI